MRNDFYDNLESLQLILNKKCNFNCEYCFSNNKGSEMSKEMLMGEVLDFLRENSYQNTTLNFFGGEPMLDYTEKIEPLSRELRKFGFQGGIGVVTNGSLFTKEIMEEIIELNISLLISLDGDFETFAKNRNSNRDIFDKVIDSIRYFTERNYPNISVRLTYGRDDITKLTENVRFIHSLGVDKIEFFHVDEIKLDDKAKEELKTEFDKLFHFYVKNRVEMKFIDDLVHFYFNEDDYFRDGVHQCGLLNKKELNITVDEDGDIFTCHHFNSEEERYKDFHIGNIKDGFYMDRVNGLEEQKLRHEYRYAFNAREFECAGCKLNKMCNSICTMQNIKENNNIYLNYKTNCFIRKAFYDVIEKRLDEVKR